ncbi:MAG: group II intron reverse transcriptase/maturase, partial [Tannerella sp.]|nr:group II intron reverse transcriptase/maturase [Tannerella sp.]
MKRIGVQDLPQPERVQTYPWYFIAKKEGIPMNVKHSTAEGKTSERLTDRPMEIEWKSIDWVKVENEVNRLQVRIAKATINKKWNEVKRLQYLLTHSYYAKLLAVKKVTTNKGKNTAGVDGELWSSPTSKMRAVLKLTDKKYKAQPLRRVYIEKKGKKEKRPLGIPTMYDRAMQALYALALDPVSESTADKKSLGFRKGRSCHDACEYIFTALSRKFCAEWILEGDIKGCFDNISHEWLIDNIPMDKSILKQFLKAGFVFNDKLFPTEGGTPQGGIISPILANMTLDGMEQVIEQNFHNSKYGNRNQFTIADNRVNFIRYADDFIVTAATPEIAEKAKKVLADFLKTRGLELSESKTLITNVNNGFDFLGWTFRKFKGKLIIKPSKKSIENLVSSLSNTILKKGLAWEQEVLIQKLNPQLRGWANYHQPVVAKETFGKIDFVLFNLLYRWAKRRHPSKGRKFVARKYWHRRGSRSWVFCTEKSELMRVSRT